MAYKSRMCAVCDSLNVWCLKCCRSICAKCNRHHGVTRATKSHKTVAIDNHRTLSQEILQSSQTCIKPYKRIYKTFRTKHGAPCSVDCENMQDGDNVGNIKNSCMLDGNGESMDVIKEEGKVTRIIRVSSNPHKLENKRGHRKRGQQLVPRKFIRVEDIIVTLLKEVNINSKGNWGCTFLDENRFSLSSFISKSVIVMKSDGSVDFRIDTKPNSIIDMVYIPSAKHIIATGISSIHEQTIHVIDVDRGEITRSIPVNTNNHGISVLGDDIVFCAKDRGVMKMNINNGTITTIDIKPMSDFAYVASFQNNVYVTNKDNDTVTCLDINGHTVWEFKDDEVLILPRGICVDRDGFVYVVGGVLNNIVVISPDGLHHAVLLTTEDGLISPCAIDYDRENDVLLVVNQENRAFLFAVRK